jgi:predicted nucleotidyltransferase
MYSVLQIEQCRDIIIEIFKDNLNSIILFGSYSKETANDKSDLDIAIITENSIDRKTKLDVLNKLWKATSQKDMQADFVIKTKADFYLEKELPTIARVIFNEGKMIWKQN